MSYGSIPPNARHFPATARNREPIARVLDPVLPDSGKILEIGSGSGEHVLYFARRFTHLDWQPSDPDPANLASIRAWIDAEIPRRPNLLPPLSIDACDSRLPLDSAAAIVCINMIHIAPWDATVGLMRNAHALLPCGGVLVLYGPYKVDGRHTAPSNAAFDRQLQQENRTWGVRDLSDVSDTADHYGLEPFRTVEMPANNLSVVFRKKAP